MSRSRPAPAVLHLLEPDAEARASVSSLAASRASADGLVVPLFSNRGFLTYLRNLLCSVERAAPTTPWFVIAMDNETCSGAEHCTYPYRQASLASGAAQYGSVAFEHVVMQRPWWVHFLLQRGHTVLMCDLDIVWLHNPVPSLRRLAAATGSDLLFQSEQGHGWNSGFYWARPTARAVALLAAWLADLAARAAVGGRGFDEQHSLGRSISRVARQTQPGAPPPARAANESDAFVAAVRAARGLRAPKLNDTAWPNGKVWWQQRRSSKVEALIVHANWVKGNKKGRLVRDLLWFLDDDDARCAPNFDPRGSGCDRMCMPVVYCSAGRRCAVESCRRLRASRPPFHPMALAAANCTASAPADELSAVRPQTRTRGARA